MFLKSWEQPGAQCSDLELSAAWGECRENQALEAAACTQISGGTQQRKELCWDGSKFCL